MSLTGGPACQSCGAPMMSRNDRGGRRDDNPYCNVCTDKSGELLSFEAAVERMADERYVKVNGMPRAAALEAARRAMKQLPAWKGQ